MSDNNQKRFKYIVLVDGNGHGFDDIEKVVKFYCKYYKKVDDLRIYEDGKLQTYKAKK